MPVSFIGYTVAEAVMVFLLIVGFINEDKIIEFEQRQIEYGKKLKRACVKLNVGFFKFIKILFLAIVTPEDRIEELRHKLFPEEEKNNKEVFTNG